MAAVEAEGLVKIYRSRKSEVRALDGVDLEVQEGTVLGLLGPIIFPLTFVSNAFVPIESLPSWLQPIAAWNPFSALVVATRELFGNPNPYTSGFPGEHPIFMSLVWTVGLLVVFAPLAVRKYRSIDR
jgi:ABC-2 type transport system permease protein